MTYAAKFIVISKSDKTTLGPFETHEAAVKWAEGVSWVDGYVVRALWPVVDAIVSRPIVKELEWGPVNGEGVETEEAHSILPGSYRVFGDEDSSAGAIFAEWAAEVDHFCMTYAKALGRFYNWEEAKAAAQADFEQRILSALN